MLTEDVVQSDMQSQHHLMEGSKPPTQDDRYLPDPQLAFSEEGIPQVYEICILLSYSR